MAITVRPSNELAYHQAREALTACYDSHLLDGHCLGWLPRKVYDIRHEEGQIYVVHNNDDHVGHAMWVVTEDIAKIYMTWVRPDARLIMHGKALIDQIEKTAAKRRCRLISLWCAEDLAANYFWRQLSFHYINWRWGRGENPRKHFLWRRKINRHAGQQTLQQLYELPECRPSTLEPFYRDAASANSTNLPMPETT